MSNPIYSYTSYKTYLQKNLMGENHRGQLSRAAEALGCQRSYLSRVLSEKLQLTPDHAFKLALFLKLSSDEQDYFMGLVEFERAATIEYRNRWKQKLAEMKKKYDSIQKRANREEHVIDSVGFHYFASWLHSAVHFLTAIPEYQKRNAIAERLGLKENLVQASLEFLEKRGAVKKINDRWVYGGGEFHVDRESPLVVLHHQNWRQRAVMDAQDLSQDGIHFTAVQTISKSDVQKLKGMFLNFISDCSAVTGPSRPEECVSLTLDFFKI